MSTASAANIARGNAMLAPPPTPPAAARIRRWQPFRNPAGTMIGYLSAGMPDGMIVNDCRLMIGPNGKPWIAWPSVKQLNKDGSPRLDATGKPIYAQIVEFRDRTTADRFRDLVLEAVRRQHPEVLEGVEFMTPLAAAREYARRGWRIVPIKPGEKRPLIANWPDLVITVDAIPQYFGHGEGLGVILGRWSGDIADVDLDCVEAIKLADLYLPVTRAEFGRPSKSRAHRLYIAPGAVKEAFADPISGETLLELRTDGKDGAAHQTVFPPSVHPSGEQIAWHGKTSEPRPFDAVVLRRTAAKLAIACLVMRYLGQYTAERPGPEFSRLLWEFDNELGRRAYQWLGQPNPENPPARLRPQRFSDREFDLSEVVRAISNNFDWEGWNRIGMAIWAASKGSHAGFQIFDDFSAKHSKYDRYDVEARWANYTKGRPNRIGMGTLVHLARQAGWTPGRRR